MAQHQQRNSGSAATSGPSYHAPNSNCSKPVPTELRLPEQVPLQLPSHHSPDHLNSSEPWGMSSRSYPNLNHSGGGPSEFESSFSSESSPTSEELAGLVVSYENRLGFGTKSVPSSPAATMARSAIQGRGYSGSSPGFAELGSAVVQANEVVLGAASSATLAAPMAGSNLDGITTRDSNHPQQREFRPDPKDPKAYETSVRVLEPRNGGLAERDEGAQWGISGADPAELDPQSSGMRKFKIEKGELVPRPLRGRGRSKNNKSKSKATNATKKKMLQDRVAQTQNKGKQRAEPEASASGAYTNNGNTGATTMETMAYAMPSPAPTGSPLYSSHDGPTATPMSYIGSSSRALDRAHELNSPFVHGSIDLVGISQPISAITTSAGNIRTWSATGALEQSGGQHIPASVIRGTGMSQLPMPGLDDTTAAVTTAASFDGSDASHFAVPASIADGTSAIAGLGIGPSDPAQAQQAFQAVGSADTGPSAGQTYLAQGQEIVNDDIYIEITFATIFEDWSGSSLNADVASQEEARRWYEHRNGA